MTREEDMGMGVCSLYGCDEQAVRRITTKNGFSFKVCDKHRPENILDVNEPEGFTARQLTALLIGTQMKLSICFYCHRFATFAASSDVVCDKHVENLWLKLHWEQNQVARLPLSPLATRFNQMIWKDTDDEAVVTTCGHEAPANIQEVCYLALSKLAEEDKIYAHHGTVCARGADVTGQRLIEILREQGFEITKTA